MACNYPPLNPPTTPIMLYIGAGYDLSPLLNFSPQASCYPIRPMDEDANFRYPAKDSYTSFIFADAKPRHTYAYMVPDFEEWKDVDSRIKNVLYYSQGLLTRWRCVPGAEDLIWFEGGGDEAHTRERISDPNWHCVPNNTTTATMTTRLFSWRRATERSQQPLTTVYYLFNTLDVEITRSPRMEKMWANVEALYVHGLMIHRSTGRGLSHSATSNPHSSLTNTPSNTGLGMSLRRVYVLVGSWHGKTGVKHVDFIKKARARLRARGIEDDTTAATFSLMNNPTSQLHNPTSRVDDLTPASNSMPALSLPFIPTCQLLSLPSFTTSDLLLPSSSAENIPSSELNSKHNDNVATINQQYQRQQRSSLDSLSSAISGSSSISFRSGIHTSTLPTAHQFHIPIPQVAWSDKLNNGRGGYYISRTVEDCQRLVYGQNAQSAEEPSTGSIPSIPTHEKPRLWNLRLFATRGITELEKRAKKPTRPSRTRRRPPKLQLDRSALAAAVSKAQQNDQSHLSTGRSWSQASSIEYYACENLSQTILSPTSTIFVPPPSAATTTLNTPHHRAQQSLASPASSRFMFDTGHDDDDDLNMKSPWTRLREKLVFHRNDIPQRSCKSRHAR